MKIHPTRCKNLPAMACLSLLIAGFSATLSAQNQQKKNAPEVNEPKKVEATPTPAPGSGAAVDPKSYKLGPEDIIFVKVWREPDLSGVVVVRPDGKITLPLIGELQGAGKTPVELTGDIAEGLSKLIN